MRHFICAAVIVSFTVPATALPIGGCFSSAKVQEGLSAEGQRVVTTTSDKKILISFGAHESGYVLQARDDGALCVVSVLQRVSTSREQNLNDICDDPRGYPDAMDVCNSLKSQALPVKRTVSANSSRSALSEKMIGPVKATFAICADKTGHEVLCGRTETLIESGTVPPR